MNISVIAKRIEISFWTMAVRLMKEPKLLRVVLISVALIISLLFGWLMISTAKQVNAARFGVGAEKVLISSSYIPHDQEIISSREILNQRKFLIIVLDQFKAENPQLESVWLATYVHSRAQFMLLPVFPSSISGISEEDQTLYAEFKVNSKAEPSKAFLDRIQSRQIRWDHYFIIDEFGLAMLIDRIGGIDLGRGQVNGIQALSQIPHAREYPQAALFAYATLARSFCRQSSALIEKVDVLDIVQQLGPHIRADVPEQALVDEWQRLRIAKTGVSCEFPNLQKSSSLP